MDLFAVKLNLQQI